MNWSWRGFAAAVLALGASVSVLVLCIGAVLHADPITAQGAMLVTGALGALVGAASAFVGGSFPERAPEPVDGSRKPVEPEPVRPEPEPESEP